jgi:hypothetical protein
MSPNEKIARSLIFYIEMLDCHRPPLKLLIYPRTILYTVKYTFFNALKKYDKDLKREIDSFFRDLYIRTKEIPFKIRVAITLIVTIIVTMMIAATSWLLFITAPKYGIITPGNTLEILLSVALAVILIFVYFIFFGVVFGWSALKRAYINSSRYYANREIRPLIQKLIKHLHKMMKEYQFDSSKFPLLLRHDDYKGLTYEKRGKNEYIAYLKPGEGLKWN